jgi:predicted AlkP superfamily phosphohydrolase/phosphomutase
VSLFGRSKPKTVRRRMVVIGIDGTPFTFLQRLMAEGRMPQFARLVAGGGFARMNSVHPTVSSVAWASFMTGQNPAKHGIFGFVDRDPATLKTLIPTSRNMASRTLWEHLSDAGKRVVVMNVPSTYPPRPVNGLLISDFLTPSIDKVAYPPQVVERLKGWGYRIDTDPWLARESKDKMLADVHDVLERRVRTMFHLMEEEDWDYFHCHIMETDRLFHFLWQEMAENDPTYAPQFMAFMEKVDEVLGQVAGRLDEHTGLIVLSDHGFCTLEQEVYVNRWLVEQGWLSFTSAEPKNIGEMAPGSVAYALDPGRVYINLKGREREGSVAPGAEYERRRDEIAAAALALRDPASGRPIFSAAFRREEIYAGSLLGQAADLILAPYDGFDPKGPVSKPALTFKGTALVGMHTFDDAALLVAGRPIHKEKLWIGDVMPTIFELMGLPAPAGLDGEPAL